MRIIQLSSDDTIIYNGIDKVLHNTILKRGLNKSGELSFFIYPDDEGYDKLYPKITFLNVIDITENEYGGIERKVVWSGQVDTVEKIDIYGTKKIVCVGLLSLFANYFITIARPYKAAVGVREYVQNIVDRHKNSVYMITGKTPITIYAEQRNPQIGTLRIYWESNGKWKRGILPVHTDGKGNWEYYGTIYQPYFYLLYESGIEPLKIRIRASAHGFYETQNTDTSTTMWKESASEDTILDLSKYSVIEKKWLIHDYTWLDLQPGKIYKMRMTSELMQIDPDSLIESSKKIYFPHKVSCGTTYDFFRYLINHKKGVITAVQNLNNKKIYVDYHETRRKSKQAVQLRRNLIDYSEKYSFDKLYTGIIPYSVNSETDKANFISASYNTDSIFYNLYVSDLLSKFYGPVYKLYEIDETFDGAKPDEYIDRILGEAEEEFLAISVKMFDESYIDPTQDKIDIGDIVKIKTADAEISEVCTEIQEYFNEPEKNIYKFGISSKRLSKYITEQDPQFLDIEA